MNDNNNKPAVLSAHNIHKSFKIENRQLDILKDISLSIADGEFVAIMGKSGSGKSTLLSILAGLDQTTSGHVMLNGDDLSQLSEEDLAIKRQSDIGFVFQSFHLIPTLSVAENIAFPLSIARNPNPARVDELIQAVELSHRADSMPNQLSGGEKQRVMIARALIQQPEILLLDEPTSALDLSHQHHTLALARELAAQGVGVMSILHDLNLAAQYADNVLLLGQGKVIDQGPVEQVMTAAKITDLYGIDVSVTEHPKYACPLIIAS